MIAIAGYTVILFGIFLITVGVMMLLLPNRALQLLKKAASTPFYHFAEISIRIIPAAAMVIIAENTPYPLLFKISGWIMIATSLILFFVPYRFHHAYALYWKDRLSPLIVKALSPVPVFVGGFLIHTVISHINLQ